MKFISQELENLDFGELLVNLFETLPDKQDTITDSEGNQLERVYEIYTGKKRRKDYLYGRSELQGYFNNYAYDTSARTVATLATDTGIDITTNLGTFTDTFVFWFHKILGKNTKFISDYWITVYTDEGLRFYKPERDSGSEQISNYQVASRVTAQDSNEFFGSIDYEGESGDIEIAQTSETVIPMTIDDDLKTLAVNKYKSFLERVIIQSPEEAKPLDYIIEDGDVYLIMSKIKNQGGNDYIYTCVKEVDDTYTFTGADVTGLVTTHNADKVDGYDIDDTGASDYDPVIFDVSNNKLKKGSAGGMNVSLVGTEQTVLSLSSQSSSSNNQIEIDNLDSGAGDDSGKTYTTVARFTATSSNATTFVNVYIASGETAADSDSAKVIGEISNGTATKDIELSIGTYQVYFQVNGSSTADLTVTYKQIQLDDIDYDTLS